MPEEKKFPTQSMLKAREEWEKKSPQEKEAFENAFKEELRKYYANRPSREHIMGTMGTEQEEW